MRFSVGSTVTLGVACLLVACASPSPTTAKSSAPVPKSNDGAQPGAPSPVAGATAGVATAVKPAADTTLITGTVTVPASLVAQGAGNIVAQGAGNIVASGGGNIVASGGGNIVAQGAGNIVAQGAGNLISPNGGTYALLATGDVPLANTEVALQLANGSLLKRKGEVLVVRTDAQGTYRIRNLPADVTYQVVVFARTTSGPPAKLKALARAGGSGGVADVTPASTLVTTKAVKGRKAFGELDLPALQAAIKATRAVLDKDPTSVDLTDEEKVATRMEALAQADGEVAKSLTTLGTKLDQNPVNTADIETAVDQVKDDTAEAAPLCVPGVETALLLNDQNKPVVFRGAVGVAIGTSADNAQTLYVADRFDQKVWKFRPDGGKREEAFSDAGAVALAAGEKFLFVGTGRNNTINRYLGSDPLALLEPAKDFGTVAGRLVEPVALAAREAGTLYVADGPRGRLWKVTVQAAGTPPKVDPVAASASFQEPGGLAVDAGQTLYVADTFHHCIKKVVGDVVTVLAGAEDAPGEVAASSEAAASARFTLPTGIAVNAKGDTVYVADSGNQAIRVIKNDKVTTIAALQCGVGVPERLSNLGGLALSSDEQYLFAANGTHVVRFKVSSSATPTPSPTAKVDTAASADAAATATAKP